MNLARTRGTERIRSSSQRGPGRADVVYEHETRGPG